MSEMDSCDGSDFDSISDVEDDLDAFAPVVADRERRRGYEVESTSHSIQAIVARQNKEIQDVSIMVSCRPQHAATLLRFFKWNKEKLTDCYFTDPEKVLNEAGIIIDAEKQPKFTPAPPNWSCEVCAGGEDEETLAMNCGHRFCRDCYTTYLTGKIKEGESRRIMCMASDCSLIVDEDSVKMTVAPDVFKLYDFKLELTLV
jgi:ariadne-1